MVQYIDKDAVVAEIERLKDDAHNGVSYHQSRQNVGLNNELSIWEHLESAFATILKIIDTLEVKEVELDKQIEEQCKKVNQLAVGKELRNICRYFFELGLKAQKGE